MTLQVSDKNPQYDLQDAFWPLLAPASMAEEKEEEKEEPKEGEEDSGEGEDGEETGGKDSEGEGKDPVRDRKLKDLHEENARRRKNEQALAKERDDLSKWKREQEDKDKSELEKFERDNKELTEQNEKLQGELAENKLELAFYKSGSAARFHDPADALMHIDLKTLDKDDSGNIVPKSLADAVEDLLKKKKYLARSEEDDEGSGNGERPPSGRPTGRKAGSDADKEKLYEKFPALRGRS